jgi:hypothetical protein
MPARNNHGEKLKQTDQLPPFVMLSEVEAYATTQSKLEPIAGL